MDFVFSLINSSDSVFPQTDNKGVWGGGGGGFRFLFVSSFVLVRLGMSYWVLSSPNRAHEELNDPQELDIKEEKITPIDLFGNTDFYYNKSTML